MAWSAEANALVFVLMFTTLVTVGAFVTSRAVTGAGVSDCACGGGEWRVSPCADVAEVVNLVWIGR